jgi:phosphoribosylaminoimidazole-succinocarboxamide synthase
MKSIRLIPQDTFYQDTYAGESGRGSSKKQLSKEFVREWLIQNGFQGKDGQAVPEMNDEKVQLISDRYIELFEKVTGNKFQKNNLDNPLKRIEAAIAQMAL